jgi:DNA-binding SARP family transcriptional activator
VPNVTLRLLGGFELRWEGREVAAPMSAQRVLAFAALSDRGAQRTFAAGTLWPDATEARAAATLRTAIWRVRALAPGLLYSSPAHLRLAEHVAVDAHDVIAYALRLLDPTAELGDAELNPAWLCGGDLLADWYDDWLVAERERIRQLRLHALEVLSERLLAARRFGEAVEAAVAAIRSEPLRESAHRTLILAHRVEGNRLEAIRAYDRWRRLLRLELGLEPSEDIRALALSGGDRDTMVTSA